MRRRHRAASAIFPAAAALDSSKNSIPPLLDALLPKIARAGIFLAQKKAAAAAAVSPLLALRVRIGSVLIPRKQTGDRRCEKTLSDRMLERETDDP